MKKQRGMKMFLSAALAGSQLLTAMSAWAEDGQPSAGQTSTVQAELQKLQSQATQAGVGQTPAQQAPTIQQVQMSSQQTSASQNLRQARKVVREERRSNGILRRLFTDNSQPKQIPGLGAPPPKIPNPPALIYRSVAGQMVQTGGTPGPGGLTTMVVSNSAAPGKSKVPIVTSNARPVNGNAKVSTTSPGFVNPFDTAETVTDDPQDAMLDLDALVAEEKAAVKKADEQAAEAAAAIADAATAGREPAVAGELQPAFATDAAETVEATIESEAAAVTEVVITTAENTADAVTDVAADVVPGTVVVDASTAGPLADVTTDEASTVDAAIEDSEAAAPLATAATPTDANELEAVPLLEVVPSEVAAEMPLAPVADAADGNVDGAVVADAVVVDERLPQTIEDAQASEAPAESETVAAADSEVSAEARRQLLASRARRDHQTYRIMARTGKTGFKGFCPVELRDNRELVDSRQDYKSRFGLQTYFFSSAEARAAFEKNPSRYAPAAGGSDVVLLVNTSEEEPGSLDFSLWYRDRLFLFRSRETQELFSKNPARYANQY